MIPYPVAVRPRHLGKREADATGEGLWGLSRRMPPGDPAASHDRDLVPGNAKPNLDVVDRGKGRVELGEYPLDPQVDVKDLPRRSGVDEARSLDERDTDFAEDRLGGDAGPGPGWRGSWHGWARGEAR